MLEENSVRKLHPQYGVKKTGHFAASPDSCEELQLSVSDIDGSKAHDLYCDIQKLKGLAKDRPIHVTRDDGRVYHFYFWMQYVQFQSSELRIQRLAIAALA